MTFGPLVAINCGLKACYHYERGIEYSFCFTDFFSFRA